MFNTVFQLIRPRQFEITFKDIKRNEGQVLVRPTHLSICNADQRYYQGKRSQEILNQKLPMALIHEGIGQVIDDPTGTFAIGSKVVMIPNLPFENSPIIGENYLRSSKFRGSSEDGFLQEYISTPADRLVSLPDNIDENVAAFTEIVSVSYHTIKRFVATSHPKIETIGIWGDGNLGFITALLLRFMYPNTKLFIFGVNQNKLNDFTFADETFLVSEIPNDLLVDHAFECVGGNASFQAVNQIIDFIAPEGTIALMGVSEDLAPLNTRMILEKGLRVFGSSRSAREDFVELVALYEKYPDIVAYLSNIVGSVVHVKSIGDISTAFEADINKLIGKTIMVWDI